MSCPVGAKGGWKLAWQTMMKELAPQDASGAYSRPDYDFGGKIGDGEFPVQSGRCETCSLAAENVFSRLVLPMVPVGTTGRRYR